MKGIIYYFSFKARLNICSQFYEWITHFFNSKPVTNVLKQIPPTIVSTTTVTIVIFIAHPIGIAECYAAVVASIVTTKIAPRKINKMKICQQTINNRHLYLFQQLSSIYATYITEYRYFGPNKILIWGGSWLSVSPDCSCPAVICSHWQHK